MTRGSCHCFCFVLFFYSLWWAQFYGLWIILQKRRRWTFGTCIRLDLKLRKIVLQNYLILITFAQRGFSAPSANPGLEEIFLVLIFPLSLTDSHHTTLHWTERLEHVRTGKRIETASAKYYNLWRSAHFSERDKSLTAGLKEKNGAFLILFSFNGLPAGVLNFSYI